MTQPNAAAEYYPVVMLHLTKAIIIAPFLREPAPEGRDELKMERWRDTIVIGKLYPNDDEEKALRFETFEAFAGHHPTLDHDVRYAVAQVMFHNPQPCWVLHSPLRPFRKAIQDLIDWNGPDEYPQIECLRQLLAGAQYRELLDA